MTILASTYRGNVGEDTHLAAHVKQAQQTGALLEVQLQESDRAKGRIHAHATTGDAIGIIKGRDRVLSDGDVFETDHGQWVLVHLAAQTVMVLSFAGDANGQAIKLIHLGHALGNHHWPILVQPDRIYVELAADPLVMEATVQGFAILGLQIGYETKATDNLLTFSAHSHH
ncbi:urease accessory protein UreE [Stenomitos frigidus]|uniref:Urease accessory protein UreE n=1 Tax=Stenomitos frigidus ULC18 TaxID=2107698 RepID=A0A2T1EP15_9CYAN|nr:urease accessory protein UreE [Stenomitos frigidus]PSB34455.1 urease accessory protein UreE [Stenomitos frigidus ULC18]